MYKMRSFALKNADQEEKSRIDEVIELKFGKESKTDPKQKKAIIDFLDELYVELDALNEDCNDSDNDDDDKKPHQTFDKEMVSSINSEDRTNGMMPFIVVRNEKTTIDIKCPFCEKEDKIFINVFESSQYDEHECSSCGKKSLLKLNFAPEVKTYIEK